MGGDSEYQTQTIRYAPYIEDYHQAFLGRTLTEALAAKLTNPYTTHTDIDVEVGFFGAGYTLSSFPSLYDLYGKFMAGLDVEVLYNEILADTVDGTVQSDLVASEADVLSDDIELEAQPRFDCGMRDINSVMSSTFIVGHALMETARTKALSRFSAEMRGKFLPLATDRFNSHLQWNRSVVELYAQFMKLYVGATLDINNHNLEVEAKKVLWPFTVQGYEITALGVLNGAKDLKSDVAGASTATKAIGGAMMGAGSGAAIGASFGASGGPIGAGIGALVGLAYGLLS